MWLTVWLPIGWLTSETCQPLKALHCVRNNRELDLKREQRIFFVSSNRPWMIQWQADSGALLELADVSIAGTVLDDKTMMC